MARSLHNYTVAEAQNAALGQAGSIIINDTATHTGPFIAITCIEDNTTIDVSESTNITDTMTDADFDFDIPKGCTIFGRFEALRLVDGKIIAYYG